MALDFDGTDDFIECGSDASLSPGTGSFSIAAWINCSGNVGAVREFVLMMAGAAAFVQFFVNEADGRMKSFIRDDASDLATITTTTNVIATGWHHVVLVANQSTNTAYLYVDGVEESGGVSLAAIDTITIDSFNRIGWTSGTFYFEGVINGVMVIHRALSIGEVNNLRYRRPFPDSDVKGLWRFDEGALNLAPGGLDCTDISGNGNHGTAEASMTDSDYVDGPPIQWNHGE